MINYKAHRIALFICSGVFLALAILAGALYTALDKNVILALFMPNYAAISIIYLFVAIFFKEKTAKGAVTAGFFTLLGILISLFIYAIAVPMMGSVSELQGIVLVLVVCFLFIGFYFVFGFIPSATYLLILMIKLGKKKKVPVESPVEAPVEPTQEQ